jgi:hypothetical protein
MSNISIDQVFCPLDILRNDKTFLMFLELIIYGDILILGKKEINLYNLIPNKETHDLLLDLCVSLHICCN